MSSDFLNLLGTLRQSFRIGINGPMFVAISDQKLRVVNIDNSEYRNMEGANPVDPQDFVTKAYTDAIFNLIVQKTLTITTIEGIQGGGDLSVNRIFRLDVNGLIEELTPDPVNDYIPIYDFSGVIHKKIKISRIDHDSLIGFIFNEHIDHSTVFINTDEGIQGGGDITVSRNLKLDINGLVVDPAPDPLNDYVATFDFSAGVHKKALISSLPTGSSVTDSINFGAGNVSSSTTSRFLYPDYDSSLAQTVEVQLIVVRPGTIQNLGIIQNQPGGNANPIVYTVRKNGVNTTLSVSIAANGFTAFDAINSFAVVAGDRVSIIVTKAASVGASPGDIYASMEFAA